MAEEEQKEIPVDNALYEAIIMSPMPLEDIPLCEECKSKRDHRRKYQRYFREFWSEVWKNSLNRIPRGNEVQERYKKEKIKEKNLWPERFVRICMNELRERGSNSEMEALMEAFRDARSKIDDEREYKRGDVCKACRSQKIGIESPYKLSPITARREIGDLYHELTQTFEVQRLKHIFMTGVFPFVRSSPTHTRYSHCEGTWILGWYALTDMKVDGKPLIDFLAEQDLHREFMASLILHDIGHAPFSHVIEINPYIEYDHEDVAKELILGGDVHDTLKELLGESIYYNRDTLYRWFGITLEDLGKWKERYKKECLLVHDVINDLGLNPRAIVELFHEDGRNTRDPAVKMLRVLISGVIDLDRVDHIYRDIHFTSYARSQASVRAMFSGFNFHYDDPDPRLEIAENIVNSLKSLLEARETTQRLYKKDKGNNFYIGLLNRAIADAVRINKVIGDYLPFITDEGLLYFLTDREQFDYPKAMDKIRLFHRSKNTYEEYTCVLYQIKRNREPYKIETKNLREFSRRLLEFFEERDEFNRDIFSTALLKYLENEYNFSGGPIKVGENKFDDKEMYEEFLNWLNRTVRDERSSLLYVFYNKDGNVEDRKRELKKEIKNIVKEIQGDDVDVKEHKK